MDPPHRRQIELQAPADFTYLLANIRASAQQKIEAAFPRSAAPQREEDALRSKVEELVQQYVTRTLEFALDSISINGQSASASLLQPANNTDQGGPPSPTSPAADDSNYEPHDPRLAEKLRMLYMQHEQETTRVAEMRRDAPGAAARAYVERLRKEMEMEREMKAEELGEESIPGLGALERKQDIEETWERGLESLAGLKGITEVVARLDRAAQAVEVVESM
ncbi:MAG: hypothetical protein Q9191_001729 [Dirinaria sp. TL-2023a]